MILKGLSWQKAGLWALFPNNTNLYLTSSRSVGPRRIEDSGGKHSGPCWIGLGYFKAQFLRRCNHIEVIGLWFVNLGCTCSCDPIQQWIFCILENTYVQLAQSQKAHYKRLHQPKWGDPTFLSWTKVYLAWWTIDCNDIQNSYS